MPKPRLKHSSHTYCITSCSRFKIYRYLNCCLIVNVTIQVSTKEMFPLLKTLAVQLNTAVLFLGKCVYFSNKLCIRMWTDVWRECPCTCSGVVLCLKKIHECFQFADLDTGCLQIASSKAYLSQLWAPCHWAHAPFLKRWDGGSCFPTADSVLILLTLCE